VRGGPARKEAKSESGPYVPAVHDLFVNVGAEV
jgi:hypothetical protein